MSSGTASLEALTASGSAIVIGLEKTASGTANVESPTASGQIDQIQKLSGTPAIEQIVAAGVAGKLLIASGNPIMAEVTASADAWLPEPPDRAGPGRHMQAFAS
jgi:hypothetical protein